MSASGQPASIPVIQRELPYHKWLCMRGRPQPCLVNFSSIGSFLVTLHWAKSSSRLFCKILWNNSGELWGQHNSSLPGCFRGAPPSHTKECFTGCRLRTPPWVDIGAVEILLYILWAPLLVFWRKFLLPGFPALQTQGHCAYLSLWTHLVEDAAPPRLFPFWNRQCELLLVLLPSFFKLAPVCVFSRGEV